MTLRTGKLDVLAAELVGPGEAGWDDVLAVFTRALVDERNHGWPLKREVFDALANGLIPFVTSHWLVHEPGHGLMWWDANEVAERLPDAPGVVLVAESVLSGSHSSQSLADSGAPTHWNLYANGEYVGTAPVKKRKPPKRCLWVWRDEDGLHQCGLPRSEPHAHTERVAVPVRPRWEGEPRCLGVWVEGSYEGPPELAQCDSLRDACDVTHLFYAKTRLGEEG